MKKEQSSNSTPKVKYALAEKYDKENKAKNDKEVDAYERLKTKESENKQDDEILNRSDIDGRTRLINQS